MKLRIALLAGLLVLGCRNDAEDKQDTGPEPGDTGQPVVDADGDGHVSAEEGGADCDDQDSAIHPDADELCDGIDNDCDGEVDENDALDASTWYSDADGDGYGDPEAELTACDEPSGAVDNDEDCDDASAASYPGADELCDGIDNDCDGDIDEDEALDRSTWYADADGDGYGDAEAALEACSAPSGTVDNAEDCDDDDAAVHPGASELCDGIDNDCDGDTDEDDALDAATWYVDADGDGYGDPAVSHASCSQPSGAVEDDEDCDDANSDIRPDADELCDGIDNDCDGDTDEDDALDAATWYADADADGYGDPDTARASCSQASGTVDNGEDCDDTDAGLNPETVWYADRDGDGHGDASSSARSCEAPTSLYTSDDTDCDDLDASAHPGGTEVCDGADNDCDGDIDEGVETSWYLDADGDGYGDASASVEACSAPSGSYITDDTDCDDLDASAHPGGSEVCDGADNDCDGGTDEDDAYDAETWYADSDADGYGDPDTTTAACEQPSGYVSPDEGDDCDDTDADTHPGAAEVCDGADNDCDGASDDGVLGGSADCAASTCDDILADQPSAADGDYYLDPDGSGATTYACDMSTDGGGWTQVLAWNRYDDGDSQADFESLMTEQANNMSDWTQGGTYIQWSDVNATADVLSYDHEIEVPNDGETLLDVYFYGYSYDDSSVFFSAEVDGVLEEIVCEAYTGWNSSGLTAWTSTEQGYWPYTCSDTTDGTHGNNVSLDDSYQAAHSDEVSAFNLSSFHYDSSYGDYSRLYALELWVR